MKNSKTLIKAFYQVSELVLFTQYVPTRSLLAKITKV